MYFGRKLCKKELQSCEGVKKECFRGSRAQGCDRNRYPVDQKAIVATGEDRDKLALRVEQAAGQEGLSRLKNWIFILRAV